MPMFTTLTIDTSLEPGSSKYVPTEPPDSKLDRRTMSTMEKRIHRSTVTQSLYATPEATPLPDSPLSFTPSPYIINHKRRRPRILKSFSQGDVSLYQQITNEKKVDEKGRSTDGEVLDLIGDVSFTATLSNPCEEVGNPSEEVGANGFHDRELDNISLDDGLGRTNDLQMSVAIESGRDCLFEDFFDPQESMSITSNVEVEDCSRGERSFKLTTPMGEYFDACEELSSEASPLSSLRDVGAELREIRLSLLMEIERRKQAEEAVNIMQGQWQRLGQELSHVGLTLPSALSIAEEDNKLDSYPAEELCQQVCVARVVSTSVGRGSAKAEVGVEVESLIESKNFEIARLWDRLRYYEAVNREMSQRNQAAVEIARCHRQRRKKRQRWFWGSIGIAIILGSAALAWSYIPTAEGLPPNNTFRAPEGDDVS